MRSMEFDGHPSRRNFLQIAGASAAFQGLSRLALRRSGLDTQARLAYGLRTVESALNFANFFMSHPLRRTFCGLHRGVIQ